MGRTFGLAGALIAGAVFMAGCASVDVGKTFNDQRISEERYNGVAHLNGDCWGIYLLSIIPLITGDTSSNGNVIAILQDTVNVDSVTDMVTRKSKELGATRTIDLVSQRSSFWLGFLFVFWYKDCQVSGNAVN